MNYKLLSGLLTIVMAGVFLSGVFETSVIGPVDNSFESVETVSDLKVGQRNFVSVQRSDYKMVEVEVVAKENKEEQVLSQHLESWIQRILNSHKAEREAWMSQWPEPKNSAQKAMLLVLSLSEIEDAQVGSFDTVLAEVGSLVDGYEKNPVNFYLSTVLQRAVQEEDAQLRANIYKYNANHGVDFYLSRSLEKDLQMIERHGVRLDSQSAQSYFEAVVNSHDLDESYRFVKAADLLDHVEDTKKLQLALTLKEKFSILSEEGI